VRQERHGNGTTFDQRKSSHLACHDVLISLRLWTDELLLMESQLIGSRDFIRPIKNKKN